MDLELWHLDLAIAHFSISVQWALFLDDHSCTWVYQLCNLFCLFHGQKSCAQLILIGHQSGWLAPAFRWLVCGLPMCVRHFVVVWKPIAWGQFFLFNMAWVDAWSLITPFKCVIIRTQQCLVPKERDGGGAIVTSTVIYFWILWWKQKMKMTMSLSRARQIARNSMILTSYRGLLGLFECTYTHLRNLSMLDLFVRLGPHIWRSSYLLM